MYYVIKFYLTLTLTTLILMPMEKTDIVLIMTSSDY